MGGLPTRAYVRAHSCLVSRQGGCYKSWQHPPCGDIDAIVLSLRHSQEMAGSSHRKKIRHYHDSGDCHELTFSCHCRRPLLLDDEWRCLLSTSIERAMAACKFRLVAFVYMPEHVHLLVYPADPRTADISRLLKAIKRPYSFQLKQQLADGNPALLEELTVPERPGKRAFRFWQEGPGYDRNLSSPSAVFTSMDYIHLNPVRRGLCTRAVDWKWSSARHYHAASSLVDCDLPEIHGLPTEYCS